MYRGIPKGWEGGGLLFSKGCALPQRNKFWKIDPLTWIFRPLFLTISFNVLSVKRNAVAPTLRYDWNRFLLLPIQFSFCLTFPLPSLFQNWFSSPSTYGEENQDLHLFFLNFVPIPFPLSIITFHFPFPLPSFLPFSAFPSLGTLVSFYLWVDSLDFVNTNTDFSSNWKKKEIFSPKIRTTASLLAII